MLLNNMLWIGFIISTWPPFVMSSDFDENLAKVHRSLATQIECYREELIHKTLCSGRSLKAPSFVSQWFVMKSQDSRFSERIVKHGLNQLPVKVDVQIKTNVSGSANGWIFPGDSVQQCDDDTSTEYGGVVYFYNNTHVLLQTSKRRDSSHSSGVLINTGGREGRFMNDTYISFSEGLVRVRIWLLKDFPDATFNSGWLPLDTTDSNKTFYELSHGLSEYPAFVSVQIRSQGWISEGMGAVMNFRYSNWTNSGGVLYGYDERTVRIWTALYNWTYRAYGKLLANPDGWGITSIPDNIRGGVKVTVWSADSFIRGENLQVFAARELSGELESTKLKNIDIDNDLVTFNVQALDGQNKGFLFKGYGSSQAKTQPYGGAIFAYDRKGKFRVWRPNEAMSGYLIHINQPYGNGKLNQASNNATYRVVVMSSKCKRYENVFNVRYD